MLIPEIKRPRNASNSRRKLTMCFPIRRSAVCTIVLDNTPTIWLMPQHEVQDLRAEHGQHLVSTSPDSIGGVLRADRVGEELVFETSLPISSAVAPRKRKNILVRSPRKATTSRCHSRSRLKKPSKG